MNTSKTAAMSTDQQFVMDLVTGSAKIDAMRARTHEILNIMLGLIVKHNLIQGAHIPLRSSGTSSYGIIWSIRAIDFDARRYLLSITARTRQSNLLCCCDAAEGYNDEMRLSDVQKVYESLPELLTFLFETFPGLRASCDPFVAAAKISLG